METITILAAIDSEIQKLQQVRDLLSGNTVAKRGSGRTNSSSGTAKRRSLSPEARAKIAAAQKARWAKVKKPAK